MINHLYNKIDKIYKRKFIFSKSLQSVSFYHLHIMEVQLIEFEL